MNTKLLKSAAMALVLSAGLATFARADDTPSQGGTIVVTYKDDMATLDPAIGYDWQNWSMINSLFSRLVDYKFGTTEIVPSLADSWTISPDGLVYTFKLNPKATFTNGRKVTAADVKYSIERSVNPKTQGPAGGFFHSIVGQDKMADGSATTISGIDTPDEFDHQVHPEPARRDLPQRARAQFRVPSCPRKSSRRRAPTSARSRSAQAPSNLTNGCRASASCSRAIPTISASVRISMASKSKSVRSRWLRS